MAAVKSVSVTPFALGCDADLCEVWFSDACERLGVDYSSATLMAGPKDHDAALDIGSKFQCRVALVPAGFFAGPDHWAVITGRGAVWSPGA